jgi:putative nucleotidyltransferase with HDIG domain
VVRKEEAIKRKAGWNGHQPELKSEIRTQLSRVPRKAVPGHFFCILTVSRTGGPCHSGVVGGFVEKILMKAGTYTDHTGRMKSQGGLWMEQRDEASLGSTDVKMDDVSPGDREKGEDSPASGKWTDEQVDTLIERVAEGISSIFPSQPAQPFVRERTLSLGDISPGVIKRVKAITGGMRDFGASYRVSQYLSNPDISLSRVAAAIKADPVLTGKILHTANSAYFGGQNIDSITQALHLLGLNNIRNIVYHKAFSRVIRKKGSLTDVVVELLWEHSVVTSICAFHVAGAFDGLDRDFMFTLGLLHDVGKFVNAEIFPTMGYTGDYTLPYAGGFGIDDEDSLFGINHCLIGRMAFENWGLSETMVHAVERHHHPSFIPREELGADGERLGCLTALFVANQIAKLFVDEEKRGVFTIEPLPPSYAHLVNRQELERRFSSKAIYSEIRKARVLIGSYL